MGPLVLLARPCRMCLRSPRACRVSLQNTCWFEHLVRSPKYLSERISESLGILLPSAFQARGQLRIPTYGPDDSLHLLLPTRPIQSRGKGAGSQDMESQFPLCHELPARHRRGEGPKQEQRQLSCAGVPNAPTSQQNSEERYARALGPQEALREGGRKGANWGWHACAKANGLSFPQRESPSPAEMLRVKARGR